MSERRLWAHGNTDFQLVDLGLAQRGVLSYNTVGDDSARIRVYRWWPVLLHFDADGTLVKVRRRFRAAWLLRHTEVWWRVLTT